MTQAGSLLEQILSGSNRNLQVLAASGLVPLPPEELIPIQVRLTASPDAEVANSATQALAALDPSIASQYLTEGATSTELYYFGLRVPEPSLQQVVIRRPDVPRDLLVQMASLIAAESQEALVLRQDAILDEPGILVELEKNPALTSYAKRRIWEYREHLLPKDKVPPKSAEEILAEADALTAEEIEEAIEEVKATKEGDGEPIDEAGGVNPGQLRLLPVPIRVKLARNADRQTRGLLIRDSNTQVALTVMLNNALPDSEVEQIANSRNVVKEVLEEIPKKREWIRKYAIAKALVKNPRANLATSLKLVPRMTMRDLRELARDKNVADGVRSVALRLYNAKK